MKIVFIVATHYGADADLDDVEAQRYIDSGQAYAVVETASLDAPVEKRAARHVAKPKLETR